MPKIGKCCAWQNGIAYRRKRERCFPPQTRAMLFAAKASVGLAVNLKRRRTYYTQCPIPLLRPLFLLVGWRMVLLGLLPRIVAHPAIFVIPPNSDVAPRIQTTMYTTTSRTLARHGTRTPARHGTMCGRPIARTPARTLARHGTNTIFAPVCLLVLLTLNRKLE